MKISFGKYNVLLLIGIALLSQCTEETFDLPDQVDFNYHIRPILTQNCSTCHGPDSTSRKANLRLDTNEGATTKLQNGHYAIVPGNVRKSILLGRITSSDLEIIMPPPESKKVLSEYEIALIDKWIRQGAKWKKHWAFIPPQKTHLGYDNIDDFIIEKIKDHQLIKSKSANQNTLIRRASYLLTGLPPTLEELQRLENEDFESVIDHYLDSKHFGEQWARHWMDLVRYAEGMGHEFDFPIGGAWQYRDYLIRAFNDDVPYNVFVKEHLAGDLLEDPRINQENGYIESVIGTAYAVLGEGKHSPVDIKKEEADRIDNMIDVTSKTFQALTVSCAKCHDHKFDPIPTTDYYAMYGMFESARIGPVFFNQSPSMSDIDKEIKPVNDELKKEISHFIENDNLKSRYSYNQLLADFRKRDFDDWTSSGYGFGVQSLHGKIASSRYYGSGIHGVLRSPNFTLQDSFIYFFGAGKGSTARIIVDNFQLIQDPLYGNLELRIDDEHWKLYRMNVSALQGHKAYVEFLSGHFDSHQYSIEEDNFIEIQYVFSSNQKLALDSLEHEQQSLKTSELFARKNELSKSLRDSNFITGLNQGDAVFSQVFIRGSHTELSEEKIPHQFLTAISTEKNNFIPDKDTRLQWVEAVIDPENPLTARVMVNRVWHHIFGIGLVETVDNFGLQGSLPSHPELLDYLAISFIEEGWSVKKLIKKILMTETFQRATAVKAENLTGDPENVYLASFPIRRLNAESIRDGILRTSGSLDAKMYGKSVPIHLTEFMTGRGRPSTSGPLDGDGRRSIYIGINRNFLTPMMLTFDMPIPFSTFGKRNTTNVPAQSLTLMNDPFVHDQAEKWANRLRKSKLNRVEEQIEIIYLTALGRFPSTLEINQGKEIIDSFKGDDENVALKEYCHIIFNMKEFIHLL